MYDINKDKWTNTEKVEMTNKVGLEANAANFGLVGTVGQSQMISFGQEGSTEHKTFRESAAVRGGVAGKMTNEYKYGVPITSKFETGYTFEVKLILGIEIKLINEQEFKR